MHDATRFVSFARSRQMRFDRRPGTPRPADDHAIRAIVLSGGSELTGLALLEEFAACGVPAAVIRIGRAKGLLVDVVPAGFHERLDSRCGDEPALCSALVAVLERWRRPSDPPWPIYATEDGGLRFLIDNEARLRSLAIPCGRSRQGTNCLDKAGLAVALENDDTVVRYLPRTRIVATVDEALAASRAVSEDCVVKPATKPLSMNMPDMPSKALFRSDCADESELRARLERIWHYSESWLVQQVARGGETGECSVWATRDPEGRVRGVCMRQHWKHPRRGGTSAVVSSAPELDHELLPVASKLLASIDYVGLCELEFMLDCEAAGENRVVLIEMNARPWLQYGLARFAGFAAASETYRFLADIVSSEEKSVPCVGKSLIWVNPERLFLAAFSGSRGRIGSSLLEALSVLLKADYVTVYGSSLRKVRRRWIARCVSRSMEMRA